MFKKLVLLTLLVGFSAVHVQAENMFKEEIEKNKTYNQTIRKFMAQSNKLTKLVHNSYAHVVFPSIYKGGLLVGYASGEGRAYYRGGIWTGNVNITQYTIGAQVGGSAYSEIIFFKTRGAFERFKFGGLEDSTQGSLVLVKGFSGDVNFDEGLEVYTLSSWGLMLEATTGAQSFEYIQKK